MKKVIKVCGLDVHKDTIFACIKSGKYQSEVKEFSTMSCGLAELNHWLKGEQVSKVAMESTGVYWMPVWRALENDFELLLVNTARHPIIFHTFAIRKNIPQAAQW